MWNKIYDKYLITREELLKPTYERIYDGHDVLIEEKIIGEKDEDDLICIRVSLFSPIIFSSIKTSCPSYILS